MARIASDYATCLFSGRATVRAQKSKNQPRIVFSSSANASAANSEREAISSHGRGLFVETGRAAT
eukprot:4654995-Ditylum_brightwellii.AAC.1